MTRKSARRARPVRSPAPSGAPAGLLGKLWTMVAALFGGRQVQGKHPTGGTKRSRPAAIRAASDPALTFSSPQKKAAVRRGPATDRSPRPPGEEALAPDRAALIREALATHRAKRRALDDLDGEDRSLLEAVAFSMLFFPTAHEQVTLSDGSPSDPSGKPDIKDRSDPSGARKPGSTRRTRSFGDQGRRRKPGPPTS